MSDQTLGCYHFLAWGRRGIAASLSNPDTGSLPSRASVNVQLSLSVDGSTNVTQPNPVQVQLFGPGDVTGIDLRQHVRTEPPNSTPNFEPNYLCFIEFDAFDLPWLVTPAAPNGDQLHHCFALIALKQDGTEFSGPETPTNPVISVLKLDALQDLSESWNWAHVQVSGDAPLPDTLTRAPGNVISRLICPRRLDPETSYRAFLVPAFKIGQDASGNPTAEPAWIKQAPNPTPTPLQLPFYYQFEFHTSDAGDFESLARRLEGRPLPKEVGRRPMDVSQAALVAQTGSDASTASTKFISAGDPLGLEGALHSKLSQRTPWKRTPWKWEDREPFQKAVQKWINHTSPATDDPDNPHPEDPKIVPPIYGRWHAAVQRVDRNAKGWVNDLNLDPRDRSAAALGAQVVQKERTQLMKEAWDQVEGVLKANQLIKQAQLARATLQQVYRQHFERATPATLMNLTAPLHARLLAGPTTTIRAAVRASRVPERMLSGAFRKATRPRRRLGVSPTRRPSLLSRVNKGEVKFVPAPKPPQGLVSIEQVSDQRARSLLRRLLELLAVIERTYRHSHGASRRLFLFLLLGVAGLAVAAAFLPAAVLSELEEIFGGSRAYKRLRMSGFTPQTVTEVPGRPNFTVTPPGTQTGPGAGRGGTDSAEAKAFRSATQDLFGVLKARPVDDPRQKPPLDLRELKTTLLKRVDPKETVPGRIRALISISPRIPWQRDDFLADPIMAAPEFPHPMCVPLRDLSPQYMLPGVELVPPDTVGLLVSNQRFIEAYMVGLNYEMARQLLWNDYLTDQRGTYFKYFWDVSTCVPPQATAPDISAIHTWSRNDDLGEHHGRTGIVANNLVLLVRGQLLQRYPKTHIYAGKAKLDGNGKLVLDESDERYPIFRGTLPNDITFLGFNLTLDEALGRTPSSPEGFFFVFQEEPSSVRFGLEPAEPLRPDGTPIGVQHWADLAWTNFASGGSTAFRLPRTTNSLVRNSPWRLASRVFSKVMDATQLPDFLSPSVQPARVSIDPNDREDYSNQWGVNSAQTAYILLRLPFRILIHAKKLLPEEKDSRVAAS